MGVLALEGKMPVGRGQQWAFYPNELNGSTLRYCLGG
jgi:hypothetical protein